MNLLQRLTRGNALVAILLALTLLVGGYFRFVGLNWDDFSYLHPDERFLTINTMPLVGGGLEFTPFGAEVVVYVRLNDQSRYNGSTTQMMDQLANSARAVAVVQGENANIAGDVYFPAEKLVYYDDFMTATQALADATVDALVTDAPGAIESQRIAELRLVRLTSIESVALQRDRCDRRYPESGGVGPIWDTDCSPLNPHNAGAGFYAYGTLPMLLTYYTSQFLQQQELAGSPIFSFEGYQLVWRALSAFFDIGTIFLVFLLGKRLHNKWVGLLAAMLYAAAVLPIQKSHFGTVNAITNFFVVLTILFAAYAQGRFRWWYYAGFGVAFGAALAGRINTIPLVGLIFLVIILRLLPAFDFSLPPKERRTIFLQHIGGLFLAGFMTVLAFRIANPHAFTATGFIPTGINPRWINDMLSASHGISGLVDSPPNWQWLGRPSYLYPLRDMLFWGMGLALGVVGWFGCLWALWRIVRGRAGALQNVLLVAWVLVYFGWLGRQWVMTMRYFLPLYGPIAILAAWTLWMLLQHYAAVPTAVWRRRAAQALTVAVVGFTFLWAFMFTNIYRHELTRVQGARWIFEQIPGDFAMRIEGAPEGTPLINIAVANSNPTFFATASLENDVISQARQNAINTLLRSASAYTQGAPFIYDFIAPADGAVSSVFIPHMGDPNDDPEEETIYISLARNGELLTEVTYTSDFSRDKHPLGEAYTITFPEPVTIEANQLYTFKFEVIEGGQLIGAGSVVTDEGAWDNQLAATRVCRLPDGLTLADDPPPGLVSADECNAQEAWQALVNAFDMAMSFPVDTVMKRENILAGLEFADYVTISSNRFYDTLTRNRMRWPMSSLYYDALFGGDLGYDLVALFNESFELGSIQISDQYLPIFNSPKWFNELEPDEAFHVYDHPAVFIYKKRDDFDINAVRLLLESIPLTQASEVAAPYGGGNGSTEMIGVLNLPSITADIAPTNLMLPPEAREMNQQGGTWSERFSYDNPINAQPVLTVLVWWLAVIGFGVLIWPLLFVAFPALADRGYAFGKFMGMFIVGYIAWVFSSLRVPLWSQSGLWLVIFALALVNGYIAWCTRTRMREYLRQAWKRIAWIEVITLLLFIGFLVVRLTNPDLWHQAKGGEKPMDFAYFNAVLRATVFPPADPWFAGGYLNYYYFGFVIVGTPTLLLGVVPSIAYNLIVPTLFAVTGIGAFSLAFSLVHTWRERRSTNILGENAPRRRLGNPWVAGIAALMLTVVLGNLDTVRVFTNGLAQAGGYQQTTGLADYLTQRYIDEHGAPPEGQAAIELAERAEANYITDRLEYELNNTFSYFGGLLAGLSRAIQGEPVYIYHDRWYWGPTRVLSETPGVEGNAITEMPYFTFLYGDLHAHMINLPVLLFILAFVYNELIVVGRDGRKRYAAFAALALGAMSVGMIRAINTWDWPSFLLFSIVAVTYIWWLRWQTINRDALIDFAYYVVGFTAMTFLFPLPYTTWYAAIYGSASLWQGGKTPLWAYFDIHGTFIFLLVSLLIWETGRWLRTVKASTLRGHALSLNGGIAAGGLLIIGSFIAAAADYQVALIVVPLVAWIVILFFRPGQSRTMRYVLVLAGFALAMTLGVEVIVIAGDIGRQNTVFKFYMQVWILLSIVGGAAFAWLLQHSIYWKTRVRAVWYLFAATLFVLAGLYPIMATRARALDRMAPQVGMVLDGMAYMREAKHRELNFETQQAQEISLIHDYNIIRWLQDNVAGTPYIVEGRSRASEYQWNGRINIYTGLPSVLGWNHHQRQQRTLQDHNKLVDQRAANIIAFYKSPDIDYALRFLRYYDVSYIIVSELERVQGTEAGIAKFAHMVELGYLTQVYTDGVGIIYEVNQDALWNPYQQEGEPQ